MTILSFVWSARSKPWGRSEYQPRINAELFFCSHLLVDVREVTESPRGGRESPGEPLGWKSDAEHIYSQL